MAIDRTEVGTTDVGTSDPVNPLGLGLGAERGIEAAHTVPMGSFILEAAYSRDGQDLKLEDAFGRELVIDGYFSDTPYLPLVNENGAMVRGDFVARLAGPGQIAQSTTSGTDLGEPVGTIESLEGQATVQHADGTSEILQPGSDIYQNDIIETGSDAVLGVLMKDGSVLGIGESSRMTIDEFVFDNSSNDGAIGLSFLKGAISFVSGKIAKNDYDDVEIKVPYGSIGIRGTEFVVDIAPDGTATVSVLDGAVFTGSNGQQLILDPGQFALIGSLGLSPVEQLAIAAIQARYERILDAQKITINIRDGREEDDEGLDVNPEGGGNQPSDGSGDGDRGDLEDFIKVVEGDPNQGLNQADPNLDITEIAGEDIGLIPDPNGIGTGLGFNRFDSDRDILLGVANPSDFNFFGTDGDDAFIGGPSNDFIFGFGGNDTLSGAGGDDFVSGGDGDDFVSGDGGDDTVDGGNGDDIVAGGEGSVDLLYGGAGNDEIYGDRIIDDDPTTGDLDTLYGQEGDDTLYGGGGDDQLFGGEGQDSLVGGYGDDLLFGGAGQDVAAFDGSSSDFSLVATETGFRLENLNTGESDTLVDIEKVSFDDDAFSLVTFELSGDAAVNEGGLASYTISLGGVPLVAGQSATVQVSITDLETSSSDYGNLMTALQSAADGAAGISFNGAGQLTFEGGFGSETSLTFGLPIPVDLPIETAEQYNVGLSNPGGSGPAGMGVFSAIKNFDVTTEISDQSAANIEWSLEQTSSTVGEGQSATYTVSFSGVTLGTGSEASIDVAVVTGSAASDDLAAALNDQLSAAADAVAGVTAVGNRLTFTSSAPQSFSFDIPLAVDGLAEGTEDYSLVIFNSQVDGVATGSINTGNVTTNISDAAADGIVFGLTGSDLVVEGNGATYTVGYAGTLAAGETASVTVSLDHISTEASDLGPLVAALNAAVSATSGVTLDGTTLTFDHTVSSLDFTVDALVDGLVEGTESFSVSLTGSASETGVATEVDTDNNVIQTSVTNIDPAFITFSLTTDQEIVSEGSFANYSLTYSGTMPPEETVSVDVTLTDIDTDTQDYGDLLAALATAAALVDGVTVVGNTVTFDSSVSQLDFSLALTGGDSVEASEPFTLGLENPDISDGGAAVLGANTSVTTTIEDQDELSLSFASNSQSKLEGQAASYTIVLAGLAVGLASLPVASSVQFDLAVDFGSADASDLSETLADALNDLPDGVSFSGNGNSVTVTISDTAAFTGGALNIDFDLLLAGEDAIELAETFNLSISGISGTGVSVSPVVADSVTTILDDGISGVPTPGNDSITGTDDRDFIDALAGDDIVRGGDGDDTIFGTAGNDLLFGEDGEDVLSGGSGNDTLLGGDANDILMGGEGINRLEGGQGDDLFVLALGDGDHIAVDTDGNDAVQVEDFLNAERAGGSDLVFNQTDGSSLTIDDFFGASSITTAHLLKPGGYDSYTISKTLGGTGGNDLIVGYAGIDDLLSGENGDDLLLGGTGDDTLSGGAGNDQLFGDAGDDLLIGGLGDDAIDGGEGVDTASYAGASGGISVGFSGNFAVTGSAGTDNLQNVERVIGSAFNDTLLASAPSGDEEAAKIFIEANDGNDLIAGNGNTTIEYRLANGGVLVNLGIGLANDSLGATNVGSDTLLGGINGAVGSDFADSLTGSDRDYVETFAGFAGNDTIEGGEGYDIALYNSAEQTQSVDVNLGTGIALNDGFGSSDILSGIEEVHGGALGDMLTGSSSANVLVGNGGDDSLDGGAGSDVVFAGEGSDTVFGGSGYDRLDYSDSDQGIQVDYVGSGAGTVNDGTGIDLFASIEAITGSDYDDLFNGADGFDVMMGGAGDDTLNGGSGNDDLKGGVGHDVLNGGDDNDSLTGGSGLDTMNGGDGVDRFFFDALSDAVDVAFNTVFNGSSDVIEDFQTGVDRLVLDGLEFDFNGSFDAADDFLSTIGGVAFDGTNADYSDAQNTGEAKLIFDGSRLYYDDNESADGYTVVAEFSSGDISGADVDVTSVA
ncbi:FecR domain-containing protein [Sneathiella sp.]|jgi:Ca2+-binding RTX toxin-like protein|uniref:FecR domain-containing protein n=1 Tax=Sneathiella sp. TaxID=1964365 RepID=UPI0039E411D3